MNTMEVNEEAFKGHSDANHSLKFSDEAEKSFKSNSNQSEEGKVDLYTGYFSSEYLTPTNSSGSIPAFFSSAGISSHPDLLSITHMIKAISVFIKTKLKIFRLNHTMRGFPAALFLPAALDFPPLSFPAPIAYTIKDQKNKKSIK